MGTFMITCAGCPPRNAGKKDFFPPRVLSLSESQAHHFPVLPPPSVTPRGKKYFPKDFEIYNFVGPEVVNFRRTT
jgi:hypothetical protein